MGLQELPHVLKCFLTLARMDFDCYLPSHQQICRKLDHPTRSGLIHSWMEVSIPWRICQVMKTPLVDKDSELSFYTELVAHCQGKVKTVLLSFYYAAQLSSLAYNF